MSTTVSIYHDCRRALRSGLYPVKIRVHSEIGHQARFFNPFNHKILLSREDFNTMIHGKSRGHLRDLKIRLDAVVARYHEEANKLEVFDFDKFSFTIGIDKSKGLDVFSIYDLVISRFLSAGQIGNMTNYKNARSSFKKFLEATSNQKPDFLPFLKVDVRWILRYENWLINEKKLSINTLSMYVRTLRSIFNLAIQEKLLRPEIYPFGRGKYEIPAVTKVKKALTLNELEKLKNAVPANEYESNAKDIWLLSYYLQGINMCDMLKLKHRDFSNETLSYFRTKVTIRTKRNLKPVVLIPPPQAREIIKRLSSSSTNQTDFVFDNLVGIVDPVEITSRIKAKTRYVNQHLKKLAQRIGINPNISFYFARHTFATQIILSGGGIELARELLNHSSVKVTEGYFAGFATDFKKNFLRNIYGEE